MNKQDKDLLSHLSHHLIIALIIGTISLCLTKNILLSVFFSFLNIGIDFDHLIEYLTWSKGKFNFRDFITGEYFIKKNKLFLFFHCWEYGIIAVIFWIITKNVFWMLLSFAIFSHLIFDTYTYKNIFLFYSFIYRFSRGFNKNKLCKKII